MVSWIACHLPERAAIWLAELAGDAWYRSAPDKRRLARANLGRVVGWMAAERAGDPAAWPAATDPVKLDRMVRAAFRHYARNYLESMRAPVMGGRYVRDRVSIENPADVDAAFAVEGPMIFIGLHFGSLELPGFYLIERGGRPVTAPMEAVDDPAIQAWFVRTRGVIGVRLVSLAAARRELAAALERGEVAGLIADRDVTGGGHRGPVLRGAGAGPGRTGPARGPVGRAGLRRRHLANGAGPLPGPARADRGSARTAAGVNGSPPSSRPRPGPSNRSSAGRRSSGGRSSSRSGPISPKRRNRRRRSSRRPRHERPEPRRWGDPGGLGGQTGRADLHVHTLASDGTAGVEAILGAAVIAGLAAIAITDHDRIDAAQAGSALAVRNGLPIEVIVGEEISTRGGHLLGLWLTEPIRPWQSLRASIIAVHEQGGLAIPAHPLFPIPCAPRR